MTVAARETELDSVFLVVVTGAVGFGTGAGAVVEMAGGAVLVTGAGGVAAATVVEVSVAVLLSGTEVVEMVVVSCGCTYSLAEAVEEFVPAAGSRSPHAPSAIVRAAKKKRLRFIMFILTGVRAKARALNDILSSWKGAS